jgi:hypothetical protein
MLDGKEVTVVKGFFKKEALLNLLLPLLIVLIGIGAVLVVMFLKKCS